MDLMPSPHATRGYDDFLGVDGLLGGDGRSMMTQENRGGEMYASIERPQPAHVLYRSPPKRRGAWLPVVRLDVWRLA